jgi:hypothetical protein
MAQPGRGLLLRTRGDEVAARGHDVLPPPSALLQGLRLPPTYRVLDLEPRLRCRECDARGKALVSIRWSEPAA